MTSGPEPEHLDHRHRDTLRQIFVHPTSHNIEWHAVLSLVEAVGTVDVGNDGEVEIRVGGAREFFERPAGKDVDEQVVMDLRRLLTAGGYGPATAGPA
jgi:hypothetical protein